MTRRELAEANFLKGYNCNQSILLAYEDLLPKENREEIIRMASSLGGGMGRLREVCGSVTGMFLICGLFFGYEDNDTGIKKKSLYEKVQGLAAEFEAKNGSIVCRDLLGLEKGKDEPKPEERTPEYYLKRPCQRLIGDSAEILEKFLQKNNIL